MKTTILPLLALLFTLNLPAQVISRFTWTSTPLTTATTGPDASSVSSSATSGYVNSTIGYAINPGLPTRNVDLIIPGSAFDVNSIDISFYFRREESVASFFKRGSVFNFQMNNGSLQVTFTTTQGSTPGNITINSGNIATVPDDHAFHFYRFQYDNNTGIARVWMDNNVLYTYTGVAGRPLAWPNAGNVIVGEQMDATGRNIPVFANLTVQNVSNAMLAIGLGDRPLAVKPVSPSLPAATSCYPNPATNFVNLVIETERTTDFDYSVISIQGNVLKAGVARANKGRQQIAIQLSDMPAGTLMLRLHNKATNQVAVFRVLKAVGSY